MATSQEVIKLLRDSGKPEGYIKQQVEALGGSYTPPAVSPMISGASIGVSGPQDLLQKSNLPKPGFLESVGNFFAPTTTANIKDVFASGKVKKSIAQQDEQTRQIVALTEQAKQARLRGDLATAKKLNAQAKAIGETEIEMPEFSQYTQKQAEAGLTGNVGDYLGRGLKSGVEIGSYLLPSAKALGVTSVMGKAGLGALGGGMRGYGSSGYEEALGGTLGGAAIGGTLNLAGQGLKWIGKNISEKAIKAAGQSESKIIRRFGEDINTIASRYGKNTDELYGPIGEKGAGGSLSKASREAENLIQETIKNAPKDTRISKDLLLGALDTEIESQKQGLNTTMVKGLTQAKKEILRLFKKDLTPEQALKLLREANKQYSNAAIKSVEKTKYEIIRKALRETLGEAFPEINDAFKTQAEVIMLRPIVEKEVGKTFSKAGQGLFNRGFELDKPTSYPVVGDILKGVGNKILPAAIKGVGGVLESPLTTQAVLGGLNVPQGETVPEVQAMGQEPQIAPVSAPQTNEGLDTGNLPKPILSPKGQWRWDETQNDWVPNKQEQIGQLEQQAQTSLTGYTPEELYTAAIKAYKAGDKSSYSQLINMYDEETKYQDRIVKNKEKLEKSKKGNVGKSIDMMEKLYSPGTPSSLSMGTKTVGLSALTGRADVMKKKVTNQEYVDRLNKYKTQMALVAGAINQAAGAGVLNGGEYARLAMESFPNEYTSEAVARAWFDNAREVLNSLPEDRATELADYLNQ